MTRAEFLKKLGARRGDGWRLTRDAAIRCNRGNACPIVAVARAEGIRKGSNRSAADTIAPILRLRQPWMIIDAADASWTLTGRTSRLRRDMLRVLGLSE